MLVSKIISGGQTGVDRGALEAALRLGFASAGRNIRESKCPNYRKTRGYPSSRTDGRPCGKCGG